MKHIKQALALMLILALLLAMGGAAEEAEISLEAEVVEIVEALEEPASDPVEETEEPEVVEPEAEEPVADSEAELAVGEEEFSMEAESFDADSDFEIVDGVLKLYKGTDSNVVIPSGVTAIGEYAIVSASVISIQIPNSVITIGNNAFFQCTQLRSVAIGEGVRSIGKNAFAHCQSLTSIDIPNNVTELMESAFYNCTALEDVHLPEGLTAISNTLFENCTSLRTIEIPPHVTSIDSHAFSGCAALTKVDLPTDLKRIGTGAFADCIALSSIDLPEGLKSIDPWAFHGCAALSAIDFPESLEEIGTVAFSGCAFTTINLPGKLSMIGDNAFENCDFLKSVTFAKSGLELTGTFESCDKLETVTFLETNCAEETVLGFTFQDCVSLREVYLPDNCYGGDLYDEQNNVVATVFGNCPNVTVYLYKGIGIEQYCKDYGVRYKYRDGNESATVSLSLTETTLTQKETVTVKASTEGLSKKENYTFSSTDKTVAQVSTKGKITAKGVGTATITATGKTSKQSASCTVTVLPAPSKINLTAPSATDFTTDDAAFALAASVEPPEAVQGVKWTSSDESVARVSEDGQVTLVGQGKATIKATTEKKGTNGKKRSASVTLNVTDPHMPASISISEKASAPLYVNKGETLTLHSEMKPVTEGQEVRSGVIWSIPAKQQKYATIDAQTGVLQAKDLEGSVTVTVKTEKKGGTGSKKKQLTDTVKITVVDPTKPRAVMINNGEKEIPLYYEAGKTLELKSTIEPETATPGVKWSISSKAQRKIATVDAATGVVTPTGTKFGVVTVKVETTAKKSNKKAATATIKIAVVDPKYPYSVKITKEDGTELQDGVELKAGETLKLNASIEPTSATEKTALTWSISKSQKKYATVDADGTVHGVKSGKTVTVTVKTANGKKDTIKVKVVP